MSDMSEGKPFFLARNTGFAPISEKDELLHPEQNKLVKDDTLTETQYFGFCVPEEGIHALAYLWHHPNLGVVSGGINVWKGITQTMAHAELADWRTFMSDSVLKNDLHDFRFANGYGVRIVEPLKHLHMTYADPVRKNSVDLHFKGVAPPIMFADGNHFEQTMKVTGELVLRGKRYNVDCYNVRDRSWGKPRQETIQTLPPLSWVTGTFNDNFSFNCNMFDCIEGNPELKGTPFAITAENSLNSGWLYRDGKVGNIVSVRKRVGRAPGNLLPITLDFEATDDLGRTFNVKGKLVSSLMQTAWQNIDIHINLMRWECEGMVAYGDCQEANWTDYFHFINGR